MRKRSWEVICFRSAWPGRVRSHFSSVNSSRTDPSVEIFAGMKESAMEIVTGRWVALALMIGLTVTAYAQSGNPAGSAMNGTQSGTANSAGMGFGTGLSTSANPGAGLTPNAGGAGAGTGGGAGAGRGAGRGAGSSSGSGPALSNMRANGTSLDISPDPRAPNLTGKAPPPR